MFLFTALKLYVKRCSVKAFFSKIRRRKKILILFLVTQLKQYLYTFKKYKYISRKLKFIL